MLCCRARAELSAFKMKRRASATRPAKRTKTDAGYTYQGQGRNYQNSRQKNYQTVARTRGPMVQEMNYFDSILVDSLLSSTTVWGASNVADPTAYPVAGINTLFAPTQGTAINNRLGRKVFVHRLRMKGMLFQPGGLITGTIGQSPQQLVRLILFCDKQTNATQVGPATLMSAYSASRSAVITSFQNRDQVGRFEVYKDKTFVMPTPTVSAYWDGAATQQYQEGVVKPFKFTVTFKTPMQICFNALSGGTIGDIVDNSFHLFAQCSSSAVATTTAPQISYQCRTYFKE